MMAVLDASVALKWQFQDGEAMEQATELLRDYVNGRIQLVAPTLISHEIVSAVNVAVNRNRISETVGYTAIQNLASLGIEL
jgi:predicted nucleic acid-binding protein